MFAVSRKLIANKVVVATTRTAVRNFALAVRYHKHGDPEDVYKLEEIDPALLKKPLGADEVSLKFLAAPINPSDINIANGVYGTQPPLPAFGGNEGVAEVVQAGANVTGLNKGDWVVPAGAPFGSWRQVANAKAADVVKVPNDIPVAYAATLAINPATAYRMLEDFAQLKPGDWIIQNGANGMVGLAVLQLARERGIKTINIVREDRPDVYDVLRLLDNLGGDLNWTDTFLGSASSLEILRELPGGVKLGLNCVGGETAVDMARVLNPGASLVTYGNMSKSALAVPEDLVAAKQLKLQGFWIADWFLKNTPEKKQAMLEDISQKIRDKQLTFFYEVHDFDDFAWALKKAQEPYRFRKVVLNLDYPDRMAEHDKRPESDYWIFEGDTN